MGYDSERAKWSMEVQEDIRKHTAIMAGIRDTLGSLCEKADASQLKFAFALDAINGRLERLEKAGEAAHA